MPAVQRFLEGAYTGKVIFTFSRWPWKPQLEIVLMWMLVLLVVCLLMCPWLELATCPMPPWPHDSWERLQYIPLTLSAGGSMCRRWMDGFLWFPTSASTAPTTTTITTKNPWLTLLRVLKKLIIQKKIPPKLEFCGVSNDPSPTLPMVILCCCTSDMTLFLVFIRKRLYFAVTQTQSYFMIFLLPSQISTVAPMFLRSSPGWCRVIAADIIPNHTIPPKVSFWGRQKPPLWKSAIIAC